MWAATFTRSRGGPGQTLRSDAGPWSLENRLAALRHASARNATCCGSAGSPRRRLIYGPRPCLRHDQPTRRRCGRWRAGFRWCRSGWSDRRSCDLRCLGDLSLTCFDLGGDDLRFLQNSNLVLDSRLGGLRDYGLRDWWRSRRFGRRYDRSRRTHHRLRRD